MDSEHRPTPRLADFLPYLLSVTSNAVSARIAGAYRDRFELTIPEWRVMAVLGDAGAMTQRELTAATLMDKVAVNRACKELARRTLVRRKPNANDGRSHHLELTEVGREMHGRIMPLALEMERDLFESFDAEERESFRRLLDRVRERASLADGGLE